MNKLNKRFFYICLFSVLYAITAFSSFWHAVEFFELSNTWWMGIILALAFEIGQAAVLLSILTSSKERSKITPWILMSILTLVQIIGNVYSSYKYIMINSPENLKYFKEPIFIWTDLPDAEATVIITYISSAILPITALLLTSMITNYLTDQSEENNTPVFVPELTSEKRPDNPSIEIYNKEEFDKVYNDQNEQEIKNLNVAIDKKDKEIENLDKDLETNKSNNDGGEIELEVDKSDNRISENDIDESEIKKESHFINL